MYKDLDLILSLKSKNPFVSLLFTFEMLLCYFIILFLLIFADASFHKIFGLSTFLFLFFYAISLLSKIHYIYTSFRYKSIHIYDNRRIILNEKKIYGDVTVTHHSYGSGTSFSYLKFYSNGEFIATFYLSISTYVVVDIPSEFILNLFNDKISDKKTYLAHSLEKYREDTKKNGKLLFKGLVIVMFILAIPALIVFNFVR